MLTELRSGALRGGSFLKLNPGLRLVAKLMLNSMSTTFSYFYGGRQEQLRTMNNEVSILFFFHHFITIPSLYFHFFLPNR